MGVQEVLGESFDVFKRHFVTFVVAILVFVVGSIPIITIAPLYFGLY